MALDNVVLKPRNKLEFAICLSKHDSDGHTVDSLVRDAVFLYSESDVYHCVKL